MKSKDRRYRGARKIESSTRQDQSPVKLTDLLIPLCTIITVHSAVALRQFC